MLIFILFISFCECAFGHGVQVEVNTLDGVVQGYNEANISMFRGIPYAEVDENNPFADAHPYPHFDKPFVAIDDSTICPQYVNGIKGSIQCLRVNVYTPQDAHPGLALPVMVFLHGGAFYEGSGSLTDWAPNFLIKHNVILVTVNYRLGPYGNLCVPNTQYNNQGLKDQVLALKWVKRNIQSFGGDSDNVILFGHSAGSISADIHLLYNNDSLFNKVILQSGQAVTPLINDATPYKKYATDIGMTDENIDVDSLIQKLSSISVETLINNTKNYTFRPCIDGNFITSVPPKKNLQNVKIIVGATDKEMLFFYRDVTSFENFDFSSELDRPFDYSMLNPNVIDDIKEKYNLKLNKDELKDSTIDFGSDLAFNYPTERSIRYYLQNNATVYRYVFKYDGDRNFVKKREHITWPGATHGDELGYIFDIMSSNKITDLHVIDWIGLLWTNFAKHGNPTPPPPSKELPVTWPPISTLSEPYLQIGKELTILNEPLKTRMAFWDSLYKQHGKYAKGINLGEKWWSES
ncbi:hypothetical protein HW555_009687 [Spodoptera exigua]|uniref:Carboxylic ester hydrolase n=1 Tax=Spodoptera exigua TaxID=7107 RepID=A0A835L6I5_SPOEX|nr:hypothetical protein HW555_009687 [Spodoptera exigua]